MRCLSTWPRRSERKTEPLRDCRRPNSLRGWGHGKSNEVLTRGAGASGAGFNQSPGWRYPDTEECVITEATIRLGEDGSFRMTPKQVLQIRVSLVGIVPVIWRRIQIPTTHSFWDLHVAIQDAMGWFDSHLHAFRLPDPRQGHLVQIGIPDDEFEAGRRMLPGWKIPVEDYLHEVSPVAVYEYDFSDGWIHVVQLEARLLARKGVSYPTCLAGERRCPPEDCGGLGGYELLLHALADSDHPEHDSLREWVGGSYDPDGFQASNVAFDDPKERLDTIFE